MQATREVSTSGLDTRITPRKGTSRELTHSHAQRTVQRRLRRSVGGMNNVGQSAWAIALPGHQPGAGRLDCHIDCVSHLGAMSTLQSPK